MTRLSGIISYSNYEVGLEKTGELHCFKDAT